MPVNKVGMLTLTWPAAGQTAMGHGMHGALLIVRGCSNRVSGHRWNKPRGGIPALAAPWGEAPVGVTPDGTWCPSYSCLGFKQHGGVALRGGNARGLSVTRDDCNWRSFYCALLVPKSGGSTEVYSPGIPEAALPTWSEMR